MGYDMYIEADLTEAEQVAKQAAEDQFNAAVKERGALERNTPEWTAAQEKVLAAADESDKRNLNYFRLNIWGMGRCRSYMDERGMVYDSSYSDGPQFPDIPYPERDKYGSDEAYDTAYAEHEDHIEKLSRPVQEHHPDGGTTIPIHKLCDNSGWIVTEDECKAAVTANALHDPPTYMDEDGEIKPVQWWPEWIAFLERAATRGGFRVY